MSADEQLHTLFTSDPVDADAVLRYLAEWNWEDGSPDCLYECLIEAYPNAHFRANRRAYVKLYASITFKDAGTDLTTPQAHALLDPRLQDTFFRAVPSLRNVRPYDHLGWLRLLRPGDNPAFLWLWLLLMLQTDDDGEIAEEKKAYWFGLFEAKLAELVPHKPTLAAHWLPSTKMMSAWMNDPYDDIDVNVGELVEEEMQQANVEYQQVHGERPRFKTTITSVVRRNTLVWLTLYCGVALLCPGPVLQAVAYGWRRAWRVHRRTY